MPPRRIRSGLCRSPAMRHPRVAFYAKRYDASKASIRLRVLKPIAALREAGIDARPLRAFGRVADHDVVVVSKAFGRGAERVIDAARRAGCGIIFDICDNRFANNRVRDSQYHIDRTEALLLRADLVTVPTASMGALLTAHVPAIGDRLRVIPDILDEMAPGAGSRLSLIDRVRLFGLRRFLDRHGDALHCVWFGNSLAGVSGLDQIGDAVARLERFAGSRPATLTIISNKAALYRRLSANWSVPHHYLPWSLASFPLALRQHRVALIPVARNAYTAGKSINRPATALLAGLGVIADSIDSYRELAPFIALDDWAGGFVRYADGWRDEQPRLAAARAHLHLHHGREAVAARWAEVLAELVDQRSSGRDRDGPAQR